MSVPVRYYCPRCETVVTLHRSGYLADKSVTPYPLEGWSYTDVDGDYESADGVRIVCGEGETESGKSEGGETESAQTESVDTEGDDTESGDTDGAGCGEPFYLNFVRFENGQEVDPEPESERVHLAPPGSRGPTTPDSPSP